MSNNNNDNNNENFFSLESTLHSLQERLDSLKVLYNDEDKIQKSLQDLEQEIDVINSKVEEILNVYTKVENIKALVN